MRAGNGEDPSQGGEDPLRGARDAVFTRTDLLRVAIRDRHVGQDWYLPESETGDGSG